MSAPSSPAADFPEEARVAEAHRLLGNAGFTGAAVALAGPKREIAAVRVASGDWERLVGDEGVRLAERLRALGFRYVALDLLPSDG